MTIRTHITANGGTCTIGCTVLAEIAKRAGCKPSTLYMIATGHKRPGHLLAQGIERATDGAVTRQDLRPDIWPPEDQEASDAA